MEEKKKHTDAYYYWFNLTESGYSSSEAIEKTAKHYGFSERNVWRWYSDFGWSEKARLKRKKIIEEYEKQDNSSLAQNRINYLKILHKLLDEYVKAGLPTKIESVRDLEIIIKNCLVLQEAPTEVTKSDNVHVTIDAESLFDEDLMEQILEEETEIQSQVNDDSFEYNDDSEDDLLKKEWNED